MYVSGGLDWKRRGREHVKNAREVFLFECDIFFVVVVVVVGGRDGVGYSSGVSVGCCVLGEGVEKTK